MFRYIPSMSRTTCIDDKNNTVHATTPELRNGRAHIRTQYIFSLVIDIEVDQNYIFVTLQQSKWKIYKNLSDILTIFFLTYCISQDF